MGFTTWLYLSCPHCPTPCSHSFPFYKADISKTFCTPLPPQDKAQSIQNTSLCAHSWSLQPPPSPQRNFWHLVLQPYSTLQLFCKPCSHPRAFAHAVPSIRKLYFLPALGLLSFHLTYSHLSLWFCLRHCLLQEPSLTAPPPLFRLDSCHMLSLNDSKSWFFCYYLFKNSLSSQHLTWCLVHSYH